MPACPHTLQVRAREQPHACSQCAGVVPRPVTNIGGELLVDGITQDRGVMPETWSPSTRAQQRKGGRR